MRVVVQGGKNETPTHLIVVYSPPRGMPGHSLSIDAILHEAFEEAYALGEVPVALMGDFNSEPGEIETLVDWLPTWSVLPFSGQLGTVVPSERRISRLPMRPTDGGRGLSKLPWRPPSPLTAS